MVSNYAWTNAKRGTQHRRDNCAQAFGADPDLDLDLTPLIPAQAGIQDMIEDADNRALGPRFRGDEWAA
jgi:hypothetical protein